VIQYRKIGLFVEEEEGGFSEQAEHLTTVNLTQFTD
jgi:hypothetical protein